MDSLLFQVAIVGIGATALTDAWCVLRRRWFDVAFPDYGLVGRWFAHVARGRVRHAAIARATPVRGERVLGWFAHYAVGMAFAALLVALCGSDWLRAPSLATALAFGLATVAAPFLLMQPAMGAGLAARRTAHPNAARVQSLLMHAVFGAGLYVATWLARTL
jgi:hypothetical protein